MTFLTKAAGAFSRPPFHVPCDNTSDTFSDNISNKEHVYDRHRTAAYLRTVDVMESSNTELHVEVFAIVLAKLLRNQLFQAIGILRFSRPGIRLLKTRVVWVGLFVFCRKKKT
jgi:hypothetical protein